MTTITILGVAIQQDELGLYYLNDLHREAVKRGANQRTKEPASFFDCKNTKALIELLKAEGALQEMLFVAIEGGNPRRKGTYVCIELLVAYARFLDPQFDLDLARSFLDANKPSIQRNDLQNRLTYPQWADIARLALHGADNKRIAAEVGRTASSVAASLRRMYELVYCNPIEVFQARLIARLKGGGAA